MVEYSEKKRCPLISIIIPVFNMAGGIVRCLASISSQLSENMEVIVIDDGSTDKTGKVVKKYVSGNSHIQYAFQQHAGVSTARNTGISLARGKFLMFIDADDEIEDNYLLSIAKTAELSDADILVWGIKRYYSDGKIEEWTPKLAGEYDRKGFLTAFPSEHYGVHNGLYGFVSNKLVKSAIIQDSNLRFNSAMNIMEDYDFFLDCYAHSNCFLCFPETGYRYMVDDDPTCPRLHKEVSYPQLITVQTKCADLLKEAEAWTYVNEQIILGAIGRLSLSMFLEMRHISYSSVKSKMCFIWKNPYCIPALIRTETRWKLLRRMLLDRNTLGTMAYAVMWNSYLRARTRTKR